jgi:uncharacterized protein (DUF305 family)
MVYAPMRTSKAGHRVALAAAVATLVASGCGGGGDGSDAQDQRGETEATVVQPGAPGEPSRTVDADEAAAAADVAHTQADVDFMRGMIHHHAQALVMTNMVRTRSGSREIPLFARRMEISQDAEIERMEQWLTERGEQPPTDAEHRADHGAGGGLMPGMLTEAELAQLAASQGRAFDTRFLRAMQRHHRGALEMVADLQAAGGGMEPALGDFTRDVEADQGIELGRIDELLARDPAPFGVRRARPSRAAAERAERLAFAGGKPRICVLNGVS